LEEGKFMNIEATKQWYCDSCGLIIEKVEDGWFEWFADTETNKSTGFRIVHDNQRCHYNSEELKRERSSFSHIPLQNVTGYDGLAILLVMFVDNSPADSYELAEIIRRVHLPNYEKAKRYWDEAIEDGIIFGERESVTDYSQSSLEKIINRYVNK
jgi:hypothetical protein